MTKVYGFYEHYVTFPEQYVTEEDNLEFNYDNWMKKGIKMNESIQQNEVALPVVEKQDPAVAPAEKPATEVVQVAEDLGTAEVLN